jgi:homoserine O-acetyltransferase
VTEKLGLIRLRAVMGISMGGMQTFEWMTAYPELLERAIPIVGSPRLTHYDLLLWDAQKRAIETARSPVEAMRTVSNIHNLALITPDKYVHDNAGKEFTSVVGAEQKATMEKFDVHDWLRQLEAMMVTTWRGGWRRHGPRRRGAKARTVVVVALGPHGPPGRHSISPGG